MKRLTVLFCLIVLGSLGSSAFAQRAFQLRVGVPTPSLGFGIEADLQKDLVAQIYGDILFGGPSFLLGGEVLFKPDLGQFDRDLRGISPYFGGGLALALPGADFRFTLDGGVEFALDRDTGLFLGGQSLFPFNGIPYSRVLLGATLK